MPTRVFDIDPTRDVDNVSTTAATATAGSVTLNGVGVSGGLWKIGNSGNAMSDGIGGARLRLSSATEGVTWLFTGKNQDGNAITETIAGAAGSPPVDTVQYFSEVSSIVSSGEASAPMTIGTTYYFATKTYPLNWRAAEPATYSTYEPDGLGTTSTFAIQEYFGPMTAPLATDGWNTMMAVGVTPTATEGTLHATAVRLTTTATAGGEVQFSIRQN